MISISLQDKYVLRGNDREREDQFVYKCDLNGWCNKQF